MRDKRLWLALCFNFSRLTCPFLSAVPHRNPSLQHGHANPANLVRQIAVIPGNGIIKFPPRAHFLTKNTTFNVSQ